MSFIITLIILAFILDMFLTYKYLKVYKEKYPKCDWTLAEANPILKTSLKYWGLGNGMIYGGVIIFIMLLIILALINDNWRYFILGVYYMVNTYHFVNWNALKRLKFNKELEGGNQNAKKEKQ